MQQRIRFNHKVKMGERRDFEHKPVECIDLIGYKLEEKGTLEPFSDEMDNEVLLYNSICILNNVIVKLQKEINELKSRQ